MREKPFGVLKVFFSSYVTLDPQCIFFADKVLCIVETKYAILSIILQMAIKADSFSRPECTKSAVAESADVESALQQKSALQPTKNTAIKGDSNSKMCCKLWMGWFACFSALYCFFPFMLAIAEPYEVCKLKEANAYFETTKTGMEQNGVEVM